VIPDQQDANEPTLPGAGSSVGALLRAERERSGKNLETIARTLKIRASYLEAIEEGRFQDLPGSAYAIGFLRSYSDFLGLDWDEVARRFKNEAGGLSNRAELVFPSAVAERNIPTGMLLAGALVIAVLIYGLWYFYEGRESGGGLVASVPDRLAALLHKPESESQPANAATQAPAPPAAPAPSQASAPAQAPAQNGTQTATTQAQVTASANAPAPVAATPVSPAPPAPAPATASTPATPPPPVAAAPAAAPAAPTPPSPPPTVVAAATPPPAQAAGRVALRADDDCWVQIRDGAGALVYSRLLHAGDTYGVPDRKGLTLTAGNAGVLTILLDGTALPALGGKGMVRHDVPLDPDLLTKLPPPGSEQAQ
jgi:cytoskeleton protein RodZ